MKRAPEKARVDGVEGETLVAFNIGCNDHGVQLTRIHDGSLRCPIGGCPTKVAAEQDVVVVGEAMATFLRAAGYELVKVDSEQKKGSNQ